jgi:hypothetical protein
MGADALTNALRRSCADGSDNGLGHSGEPRVAALEAYRRARDIGRDDDRRAAGQPQYRDVVARSQLSRSALVADAPADRRGRAKAIVAGFFGDEPVREIFKSCLDWALESTPPFLRAA